MSRKELESRQIVETVRNSISLANVELPNQFFPAHLSVALVDAVFRPALGNCTDDVVDRYCRRFELPRTRSEPRQVPQQFAQDTLGDLIRHYNELGVRTMADRVFQSHACSPATGTTKAALILGAARALSEIGLDDLQTVSTRRPEEIEDTLRPLAGIDATSIRLLLMYLGGRDFVRGDFYLRAYVASALGRKTVSSARAERLIRNAAHELILSPRYLDHAIWQYASSAPHTAAVTPSRDFRYGP